MDNFGSSNKFTYYHRSLGLIGLIVFFSSWPSPALASDKVDTKEHSFGQPSQFTNKLFSSANKYQPYLEIGGAKYFNQTSSVAGIYDLFIPLLQQDDQLLFTDLRIFDRSGSSFEGNAHVGYRKLYLNTKQMFGVYVAFDRRRSDVGNNFNQITLGFEYWQKNWFLGGNVYKPLGKTKQLVDAISKQTSRSIVTTKYYEKSLPGLDAELGYSFNDSFTGYVGGYYFHANGVNTTAGPKVRFTYDYNKPRGRILGVLDRVSVEIGAQHDKPRGNTAYLSIKLKAGLTDFERNGNVSGFERHMAELVRRDPDIVVGETKPERIELADKQRYIPLEGNENSSNEQNSGKQQSTNNDVDEKYFERLKEKPFTEWQDEDLAKHKEVLAKKLGLSKDVSYEEAHKIRREFAIKNHPDKHFNKSEKEKIELAKLYRECFEPLSNLEWVAKELWLRNKRSTANSANHDTQFGGNSNKQSDFHTNQNYKTETMIVKPGALLKYTREIEADDFNLKNTFVSSPKKASHTAKTGEIASFVKYMTRDFLSAKKLVIDSRKVISRKSDLFFLLYLPRFIKKHLNIFPLEDDYGDLIKQLKCSDIKSISIGAVYFCKAEPNSYYIKLPREADEYEFTAIKSVVGAKFYQLFLQEEINVFFAQKAIISNEIVNFKIFRDFFDHITYMQGEDFEDGLLFNGDRCLAEKNLLPFCIDRRLLSYVSNLKLQSRLLFQFNLNRKYIPCNKETGTLNVHDLKYIKCEAKRTLKPIMGFEDVLLASFLLNNHDLNFRNLGLIDKGDYNKVFVIDYDDLGSNHIKGQKIAKAFKILKRFNRLTFYDFDQEKLLKSKERLLAILKKINPVKLANEIMDKLPGINTTYVAESFAKIFDLPEPYALEDLDQQLSAVIDDLLPNKLREI